MIIKIKYITLMAACLFSLSVYARTHVLNAEDVKSIVSFLTSDTGFNIGSSFNTAPYESTNKLGFFNFKPVKELYPFIHYELAVTPISKKLYTLFMSGHSIACATDTANFKSLLDKRFGMPIETNRATAEQSKMMYIFKDTVDNNNILLYSCDIITNEMYIYYYRDDLTEVFNKEVNDWYDNELNF